MKNAFIALLSACWLAGSAAAADLTPIEAAQLKPARDPNYIHVQPFPPGGDFTLAGHAGPVHLSGLRGKVVVLFFGYTMCPDVCPMSMSTLSQAVAQLKPRERKRIQAVFISVDPERDTPEQLRDYASGFDMPLIAVTGKPDVLAEVADRYGAQYRRVDLPGSAMGYAIDHSAALYLIDRRGKLRTLFRHTADPALIAQAIHRLLR